MKKTVLFLFLMLLVSAVFGMSKKPRELPKKQADKKENKMQINHLTASYKKEELKYSAKVPAYSLPLDVKKIANYDDFISKIKLNADAVKLLSQNGFVVIDNQYPQEDMAEQYEQLKRMDLPIFITSASLLHFYHIQFSETLRRIEEQKFYEMLWHISQEMYDFFIKEYRQSKGDKQEAMKRNAAYFAIALELLKPKSEQIKEPQWNEPSDVFFSPNEKAKFHCIIAPEISGLVTAELILIKAHSGFDRSPLFIYKEDYSQYIPRGHYTRSEKLKNYFLTMMWYGRMTLLLKGTNQVQPGESCDIIPPCTALISNYDAKIQTLGALEIARQFEKNDVTFSQWQTIYDVTAFYVGISDDLGPLEYKEMLVKLSDKFQNFDEKMHFALKEASLSYPVPKIYGGSGDAGIAPPYSPDDLDNLLQHTMGFRFMGQRFVPDSYMFQQLVFPKVDRYLGKKAPFSLVKSATGPTRGFPRGMDVMALLGSKRAFDLLTLFDDTNYERYQEQFNKLQNEFNSFNEKDWHKNLYWSWLYSLKTLIQQPHQGFPTFMQTKAWQDKTLTTALASWAQLRHDTILYAKQSYTAKRTTSINPSEIVKPVVGYVEPVPEFYHELMTLTRMTLNGLNTLQVLDEISASRLHQLELILKELTRISIKELANEELAKKEYDFIKSFGDQLNGVLEDVSKESKKTTIVADVHTDGNSEMVLEEAVGYVKLLIVAYLLPDSRILIGAGPEFSYYEFKHPMSDRLTNEKWREMLQINPPPHPEWQSHFGTKKDFK
jgi:hypothetical protein